MAGTESLTGFALVDRDVSVERVTKDVADPIEGRASPLWWAGFLFSLALLGIGFAAVWYQFAVGLGVWGLNSTVGWAFDITNFVFWVGIGHAGTLISAILLLFRQRWRNAVNRSAEAMTLFAVMCAGIFPIIHLGRPWLFFWVMPYPNTRGSLWINFRSPLVWDFFAIGTYFTVSAMFWYVGLIPDLATVRDRTSSRVRKAVCGFFAMGWSGSHRAWHHYEAAYLLLAGLATPLVLSVHTVVSWDFGVSILPGWHSTIFPPYFVDGAILSGLSMVLTLLIVARKVMHFEAYITQGHLEAICKLIIVTSGIIGVSYGIEAFIGMYSGNPYEQFAMINRATGQLAWGFWLMIACNAIVPQLFWFKAVRRNLAVVFVISLLVNVGMWFERFIIIVTSLQRSFLEPTWAEYAPTLVELAILAGSFGLFFTCFLLFCRWVPMISIAEVKTLVGHRTPPASPMPERATGERQGLQTPASFVFDNEAALLAAVRDARARGVTIVDVFTPYPVHGLSKAMGLPPSRLPRVCLAGGILGVIVMTYFQFWVTAITWPLNIGGKPWNSLPAFMPPIFETMVLFAAMGTVGAMFVVCRLAPGRKPAFSPPGATDNRFVMTVDAAGGPEAA